MSNSIDSENNGENCSTLTNGTFCHSHNNNKEHESVKNCSNIVWCNEISNYIDVWL